ncbi:MAG: Rrf2 family transcriptional regulator [Candidatus Omnitrophica bacterium]|nr:Rrf2 family transcriptional regulator [Candidatus Omnitrophota bacterium]
MMKLSKKTEYALKALIELAINHGKGIDVTLISDIAERENIPPRYLEQILLRLKNSGILFSKRGVGGGYALNRPPEEISLGSIIKEVEGPLSSFSIGPGNSNALDDASSGLNSVMSEVSESVRDILNSISLKDMAKRTLDLIEEKKNVLNYAI